jgi:hypothetical protein
MDFESLAEQINCLHLEKRIIERVSRGIPLDKRPDLVIWLCHFPMRYVSGIQCPVIADGAHCPYNGPYCNN